MPRNTEIANLLARMDLSRDLAKSDLAELATHCQLSRVDTNWRIRRRDLSGLRLFLVDGHLRACYDGFEQKVDSCLGLNSPPELFDEGSSDEDLITAEGACILLRFPAAALDALTPTLSAVEVEDIELDDAESDFLAEIYELISSNRLELPARPEIALKIQALTANPEAGIGELIGLIQSDATLAGAILHATNSVRFRAAKEIYSVRDAVIRLGLDHTRILATNLAMRQIFKARQQATKQAMQEAWKESVHCSIFSHVLAEQLGILNPDRALLAGLVRNIGAVPIIQYIDRLAEAADAKQLALLIQKLLGISGVLVINYWGLGEDLVNVAENGNDWSYRAPAPDYATLALAARWAAAQQDGLPHPPAAAVPAFEVLNLAQPDPKTGIVELQDSANTLDQLRRMFGI